MGCFGLDDARYVKADSSNIKSSQQPFAIRDACAVAVQLIVEGGPITLSIVEQAIRTAMPVIVLEGSGRCADVISYAWRFLHDPSISARTRWVGSARVLPCVDVCNSFRRALDFGLVPWRVALISTTTATTM